MNVGIPLTVRRRQGRRPPPSVSIARRTFARDRLID
jgi:hypothetical protein